MFYGVLVRRAPIAVAAGLREKRPARQDSRPSQQPLRDHLRPRGVESPGISDGGEALVERLFDECGNAQGEGGQGARRPAVGLGGGEMDVRVGEAGEQEAAGRVDNGDIAIGLQGTRWSDAGDPPVLDENRDAGTGVGTGAVDEGGVVEKERGHISTARRGGARPHLSCCECHLSHPPARYVILLKSGDTP